MWGGKSWYNRSMPELPEVESVKLQLQKYLKGHVVEHIDVNTPKVVAGDTKKLVGGKVKKIRRFGKVLVFDLGNGYSVVTHIKLTGQFIYRGPNLKRVPQLSKKVSDGLGGKHTHVVFHLNDGGHLYYNDMRRFGWIKIMKTSEVEREPFIKKLGPEPFGELTQKLFGEILGSTKRSVKVLIMDQSKIGGIGNIYANDALFLAKIDPRRPANSLEKVEVRKLFRAIGTVLKRGLSYGGASELAFVTPDGAEGEYQEHTLVYGKEGSVCKHGCQGRIEKFRLGGRGTYWCPDCQN